VDIAMPMQQDTQTEQNLADADRALLDAFCRNHDREAMSQLLRKHAEGAFRVALRMTGNAADAEDAVQDAFIRSMVHARSYRGAGTVRSWLVAIVANTCRERARAEATRRRREQYVAKQQPADSGRGPEESELREQVANSLATLPEHYRLPVTMRYVDELSFSDIAAALGIKEKSIRTRVSRGLERLRDSAGRCGYPVATSAIVAIFSVHQARASVDVASLVQTAVAKGSVIPLAAATALSLKAVVLAAAIAATTCLGGYAWLQAQPKPFPINAAATVEADPFAGIVAQALDHIISVRSEGSLEGALVALQKALPKECRVAFTAPDALFTGIKRSLSNTTYIGTPDFTAMSAVTLMVDRIPLREALHDLCEEYGYRWRAADRAIVIDKPIAEAERTRMIAEFESALDDALLIASITQLMASTDSDCLRPLLLALGKPGHRADVVAQQIGTLFDHLGGAFTTVAMPVFTRSWPSPAVAFDDDEEVKQAVLAAVTRLQEPRTTMVLAAGQLRLVEVVDGCIALVNAGFYHQTGLQRFLAPQADPLARAAADALGWIGGKRVVTALIATITKPNYLWQPGDQAVSALGRLQDPLAVQPLLACVTSKGSWEPMRSEMVAALGSIGDDRAVKPLGIILSDRTDKHILQWHVPSALACIGTAPAIDLICRNAADEGADRLPRSASIAELGYIGGERVEQLLLTLLSGELGDYASAAIGRIKNPKLVPILKRMLDTSSESAHGHVAAALQALQLPEAEQALVDTIPASDSPRLWYHLHAMGGSQTTREAVIAMTKPDKPPEQRRMAGGRLPHCGEQGIRAAYTIVRGDFDVTVRTAAIDGFDHVLYRNQAVLGLDELQHWLTDAEPQIRAHAVTLVMSRMRDASVQFRVICAALEDPVASVRRAAVPSAFCMGNRDGVAAAYIKALAQDPEPELRALAVGQLRSLMDPDATIVSNDTIMKIADALLVAAKTDESPRVRATAVHTLLEISAWISSAHGLSQMRRAQRKYVNLSKQNNDLARVMKNEKDERVKEVFRQARENSNNDYLESVKWKEEAPPTSPAMKNNESEF
jgi:RNA polymerase sigma factor (sigma-70 family)